MSEAKIKELPRSQAPAVLEMSWDVGRAKNWKAASHHYGKDNTLHETVYNIGTAALWDTIKNGGVLVVSSENGQIQIIQRPLAEPPNPK